MKKIISILLPIVFLFSEDLSSPSNIIISDLSTNTNANTDIIYFNHNQLGNICIELQYEGQELSSILKSTEIRLKSPSNIIYNLKVSGELESGFSYNGNLSDYIIYSDQLIFNFALPYQVFEMGQWSIHEFILINFSDNIVVLSDNEFLELNLHNSFSFDYDEYSAEFDTTAPSVPNCFLIIDEGCCGDFSEECSNQLFNEEPYTVTYQNGYAEFYFMLYGLLDNHNLYSYWGETYSAISEVELIFLDQFEQQFNIIISGSGSTTSINGNLAPYSYYGWAYYIYPSGFLDITSIIPFSLFGNNTLQLNMLKITDYSQNSLILNTEDLESIGFNTSIIFESDSEACTDTDNGATDSWGENCDIYTDWPDYCGIDDDDDFFALDMCCVCGGGVTNENIDTVDPYIDLDNDTSIDIYDNNDNYIQHSDEGVVILNNDEIYHLSIWYSIYDNTPQNAIFETGFTLESPSGQELNFFIQGTSENFSTIGGELSDYCWFSTNNNGGFVSDFIIPPNIFELGTWNIKQIYATDYSGNTIIYDNNSLDSFNLLNKIRFESSNSLTQDSFYDYNLLTWNWGNGDNIIVNESALDIFSHSDTLYIYDDNAIITDDCNSFEFTGTGMLNKYVYLNNPDNINMYCNQGADECIQYEYRRPGFVEGNPMLFSYYDNSDNLYYELSPNYNSGNGTFGVPFDDTLTFKYFDSENNLVYDINEHIIFENDMHIGDALNYYEFTIDENNSQLGIPNWDFNLNEFRNSCSVTSSISGVNEGDIIAAFIGDEVRGIATAISSPFDTIVFLMLAYTNPSVTTVNSFEVGNPVRMDLSNNLEISQNNRNSYNYNIYKNGSLYLDNYNDQYYFDYDLEAESCYEIYLIDSYDNSEFLSTEEVCYNQLDDQYSLGDVNQDSSINVSDIVLLVEWILNQNNNPLGDVNEDGSMNVSDIVLLVEWILNP